MEFGVDGSRPPVIDIKGDSVVPRIFVVDAVLVADGTRAEESRTQSKSPRAEIDQLAP